VDARRTPDEELRGPAEPELLDFLGAERGDTDLGDPDRQIHDRLDLAELVGPLLELPVVPVERGTRALPPASTPSSAPWAVISDRNCGSIGDIPPSTRGNSGFSAYTAAPAVFTMSP
jgi:hypothetical protein